MIAIGVPGNRHPHRDQKISIEESIDELVLSAKLKLKGAQISNLERHASISVKLSKAKLNEAKLNEAKLNEAETRLKNLEAEKLEAEIERDLVLESQAFIERAFQRGELTSYEENGEIVISYKKKK